MVYAYSEQLRAAHQPRRGRARQGLAATQDARRRLAEARRRPRAARPTSGRTPASSCSSWAASSRSRPSGPRAARLDWHAARRPRAPRACTRSSPTSTASTASTPALWAARPRARRASSGSTPTTPTTTCSPTCARDYDGAAGRRGRQLRRHPARGLPPGAARSGGAWREALNTDAEVYGGSGVGNLGEVEAEARAALRPSVLRLDPRPPAGRRRLRALTARRRPTSVAPRYGHAWRAGHGMSGAGKSTLLAALTRRGAPHRRHRRRRLGTARRHVGRAAMPAARHGPTSSSAGPSRTRAASTTGSSTSSCSTHRSTSCSHASPRGRTNPLRTHAGANAREIAEYVDHRGASCGAERDARLRRPVRRSDWRSPTQSTALLGPAPTHAALHEALRAGLGNRKSHPCRGGSF